MTYKKFDNVFANSGALDSFDAAKKDDGLVGGDRISIENWNALQNGVEQKINDMVEEGPATYYPDATDVNAMITTGLWDDSWGLPIDTANVISGGATKQYIDMAPFFTADNEPRLPVLDATNNKIEVWNPRTLALVDTSDALDDDLPAIGAEVWEPYSMFTDGTSVYVMLRDSNATPDTHQIQAWDIATWDVKTGWPTTGTALSGTGNTPHNSRDGKVIMASATKLATVSGWITIASSASTAISIIDITNGTIDSEGAGDAPTGVTAEAIDSICSDGTNIYFAVRGATNLHVCTATIADPTAGCGGAGYPLSLGAGSSSHLTACGPKMITNPVSPIGGVTEADIVLYTHDSSDADLDQITVGQNTRGTPDVADGYLLGFPWDACFDGRSLWILGSINPTGGDLAALTKVDVAKLFLFDTSEQRHYGDVVSGGPFIMPPDAEHPAGGSNWIYYRCVFDGRDIWVNVEPRASQPNSGKLMRLPQATQRT